MGDSLLQKEGMLRNFHFKRARISSMTTESKTAFNNLKMKDDFINFNGKKIFLLKGKIKLEKQVNPINIEIVLISKNPKIKIRDIISSIAPQVIVLDGTNSLWTIAAWKKECEELHLRCHSVAEDGAFILSN